MSGFEVGQTVVLVTNRNRRGQEDARVEIDRVARKYVYVTHHGRERRFDKETGQDVSDYGVEATIYSEQDYADRQALHLLNSGLWDRHRLRLDAKYSFATRAAVLAALDADPVGNA